MSPQSDSPAVCALCLELRPLLVSHLIPAFVGRHLKTTSATGHLRGADPNFRIQDLPKQSLLCSLCEQTFSKWEKEFSEEGFSKFQEDGFTFFEYDHSLLKFAVSLSWRSLVTEREKLTQAHPELATAIEVTLENWRRYLLGLQKDPGSIHHLFVMSGIPVEVPASAHLSTLHYFLQAVDATPLVGPRRFAIYVKLMRGIFYAPIIPSNPNGWVKTRIHNGPGRVSIAGLRTPIGTFLESRVEQLFNAQISEKQVERIRQAISKDPERVLKSEFLRINQASQDFWGNGENE